MSKAVKNIGSGITSQLTKQVKHKYEKTSDNYWLRGAIQIIPAIGGTLDTWFFQFAEKAKQERVEQTLSKLDKRIDNLGNEIDVEYIEKHIEEYAYLFEKFVSCVAQEYREDLRVKFANLMSNLTTKAYTNQQNKEVYLSKLSEISPNHLLMLQLAYDYSFIDGKQDHEKTKSVRDHIIKEMKEKQLDEALIFAILTDLQSKGLMNEVYHATFGGGLYTYHVTALGRKLLELVK